MPEELTLLDLCWENRHLSGEIHQMNNRLIALIVICLGALTGAHSLAQDKPTPEEILESWLASAHADSTTESFRHWDTEGEIPGTCAVCHSTTGIVDYLATPPVTAGVIPHSVAIGTTVECAACHNDNAAALEFSPVPEWSDGQHRQQFGDLHGMSSGPQLDGSGRRLGCGHR